MFLKSGSGHKYIKKQLSEYLETWRRSLPSEIIVCQETKTVMDSRGNKYPIKILSTLNKTLKTLRNKPSTKS
jgi:hypothetical protein